MAHEGPCYRCSTHGPATAEEHLAKDVARQGLLKDDGTYRGDDVAIALGKISADNDGRGPKKFIRIQNEIIGEAADNAAEHMPDTNHCIKNLSNNLYDVRKKDPSFNGTGQLENNRIRSICSDARNALSTYHPLIGNAAAKKKCLDQLCCIIPHHCGDHSKCTDPQYCSHLRIKQEHSDWTEDKVNEEVAKQSLRFGGRTMDLSDDGKAKLMKVIMTRFNSTNIDRLAEMGESNSCEGFWGTTTRYTEGKRINCDQTDYWKSILDLCFARAGNIERTMNELSDQLGLEINEVERQSQEEHATKRKKDGDRNKTEQAKIRREQQRVFKATKMGQEAAKSTKYKNQKVPLNESAKSSVKPAAKKSGKKRCCSKCKQEGHTAR